LAAAKTRLSALAIAPTAVLLIASVFLIVVSSHRLRASRDLVIHTHDVISTARLLLSSVQDAETGERGYVITQQPEYLDPYRDAVARIPRLVAELRGLTRDNPAHQKRVDALSREIDKKLAALATTIGTLNRSGFEEARLEIMSEAGREAMLAIRRISDQMINEEQTLLAARTAAADETEWRTLMVAIATMLAALAALALAQLLLVRRNAQLRGAEANAALKAGLLQATLDHTREGIAAWDASGRLQAFNLRFFEQLELPRELAAHGTTLDAVLARDAERSPAILQAARAGRKEADDDVMFHGRVGPRVIEIGAHPTGEGGFLLSSIDVTRRAQAEEVALQAQKMEAIGHLTGGIAHDFNNLLQIIRSNLDLLAAQVGGDARARDRIAKAVAGTERGGQLTRQLLAFARRQPLEPRVVNLGRMVNEMADLLRRTLGERIEIETVVSGGLWNTLADPAQIENAILNLAINARDAMPDGGKLTIELANAFLDDAYVAQHGEAAAGQYVLLAVTDAGTGMAPDVLARAFEPFFTTKPEGQGTGLGLPQVYGFVRQSGGHIKIYSEVGHGTSVKIYLPRALREQEWAGGEAAAPMRGGSESILVVEDDTDVRRGAVEVLQSLGYRVTEAADADEALALLAQSAPVDLLFTDVVMPGAVKAAELAQRARERNPRIAVLFTSGYTENAVIHNRKLDADRHLLSKPYRKEDLARKIRAVLAEATGAASAANAGAPAHRRGDRLRVLVVEDDPMVRTATLDMIAELGHEAEEAGNGREALQKLDAGNGIDLLLTDVGLPDMRGEDLAAECRKRRMALPVIFATGYDSAGAKDAPSSAILLAKPFVTADIRRAIEAALATRAKPGAQA
jgi:signal transduction histidine kinase/DNA-binding response OmpR family regulator